MGTFTAELSISTGGDSDIVDITDGISQVVSTSGVETGVVHAFVAHSTAALTTIEYEPGCVQDLKDAVEHLIPQEADYNHNRLAGDSNAHSHLRAAIIGPSETLPIRDANLVTGTWQQIVLVDFDDRPRERRVTVTVLD